MIVKGDGYHVRLGVDDSSVLSVPGDLLTVYQPVIGYQAVMVWINLRFDALQKRMFSPEALRASGLSEDDIAMALDRLHEFGLISETTEGEWILHDPLPQHLFDRFVSHAEHDFEQSGGLTLTPAQVEKKAATGGLSGEEYDDGAGHTPEDGPAESRSSSLRVVEATKEEKKSKKVSAASAPPLSKEKKTGGVLTLVDTDQAMPGSEDPDMQAVIQIYQKRIGMIGPTQYEKIRFWVEEQGMEGAVVAVAIEETVRSAEVPRISYLEGILRNWYNDGIRTFSDLTSHKKVSKVLSGGQEAGQQRGRKEGTANASAYERVSPEKVAKWKELYPDEYD